MRTREKNNFKLILINFLINYVAFGEQNETEQILPIVSDWNCSAVCVVLVNDTGLKQMSQCQFEQ